VTLKPAMPFCGLFPSRKQTAGTLKRHERAELANPATFNSRIFRVGLWRPMSALDGACFSGPSSEASRRASGRFSRPCRRWAWPMVLHTPGAWPPTNYAQGQLFLPVLLISSKPRSYAFPCREVHPVCGGGALRVGHAPL
jgi:hypothetical protein